MVLLANSNVNAGLPMRLLGGSPANLRTMWGRSDRYNAAVGEGINDSRDKAGVPYGHRPPSCWVLPRASGAMSAFTAVQAKLTVTSPNVVAGRNMTGSATMVLSVGAAQLQLVVNGAGQATITFTTSGTAAAALSASGTVTMSFSVGPSSLGAIVDAAAQAVMSFTTSGTATALGYLSGAVVPYSELSPENLARAVWERALEAGFTAEQIMRVLAAVAAGRTDITDLGGGNATVVFRDLANTKNRVDADMTGSERTNVDLNVT